MTTILPLNGVIDAGAGRVMAPVPPRRGRKPVVIEFASGSAKIEVAARAGHRDLVTGPLRAAFDVSP